MKLELMKEFTFESAHILPKHNGKCSRLHGHSWKLRVYIEGVVKRETGFVMDFADIKSAVQPLVDDLDHRCFGDWTDPIFANTSDPDMIRSHERSCVRGMPFDLYPTSENLIVWIADNLPLDLSWSRLEIDETCTSRCILTREEYASINPRG